MTRGTILHVVLAASLAYTPVRARADAATLVHVRFTGETSLWHKSRVGEEWSLACPGPCVAALPADDDYQVRAPGSATSDSFRLQGSAGGAVEIAAEPSSRGEKIAGAAMVGTGLLAIPFGLLFWFAGGVSASDCDGSCPDRTISEGGLIAMATGAALAVVGAVLLLHHPRTTVSLQSPEGSWEPAPRGAPPAPSFRDEPARRDQSQVVPAIGLPLLHLTF